MSVGWCCFVASFCRQIGIIIRIGRILAVFNESTLREYQSFYFILYYFIEMRSINLETVFGAERIEQKWIDLAWPVYTYTYSQLNVSKGSVELKSIPLKWQFFIPLVLFSIYTIVMTITHDTDDTHTRGARLNAQCWNKKEKEEEAKKWAAKVNFLISVSPFACNSKVEKKKMHMNMYVNWAPSCFERYTDRLMHNSTKAIE